MICGHNPCDCGQPRSRKRTLADQHERIHAEALRLQAAGPDEYPLGYYEHLARERIEGGEPHGDDSRPAGSTGGES